MANDELNICSYKTVCRKCTMVGNDDRPEMCVELQCDKFTPCKKCGKNLTVNRDSLCRACVTGEKLGENVKIINDDGTVDIVPNFLVDELVSGKEEQEEDAGSKDKELVIPDYLKGEIDKIISSERDNEEDIKKEQNKSKMKKRLVASIPGKPPEFYNESSKKFYQNQWELYKDYWGSDPTTYVSIHSLILIEHDLIILGHQIAIASESQKPALEKHRQVLLGNVSKILKEMPESSIRRETEETKTLASIYNSYVNELNLKSIGDLRRIFTPEAIVLSAILPYKIDLNTLLDQLNIKHVNINDTEKSNIKDIACNVKGKNLADIVSFIGFPINEDKAKVPNFED